MWTEIIDLGTTLGRNVLKFLQGALGIYLGMRLQKQLSIDYNGNWIYRSNREWQNLLNFL